MIVGPKPRSSRSHTGPPLSSGFALTVTSCCSRSRESWFVFANDGISVTNCVEDVDVPAGFVAWRKVPCSSEPVEATVVTLSASTCCRKKGLYGTRIRVSCVTRCAAQ